EMPLFIPPEETIERFENECAPLVELVRDQLFQSTKLQTLRDALLPDLVSGRIRVLAEEGAA
ncbi:restriction endonuclease subunit S, partial [Staphylococcus epidermidis]